MAGGGRAAAKRVLEQVVYRGKAANGAAASCASNGWRPSPAGRAIVSRSFATKPLPGMWIPALLYEPEKLVGQSPGDPECQRPFRARESVLPKQIRCINQAKRGMLALNVEWLGMGNSAPRLQPRPHEPARPVRHQRPGPVLPLDEAEPRSPFELGAYRPRPGGRDRTLGRRLADDLHQLARHSREAGRARGRLFELPHAAQHLKDLGDSEQTPNDLATVVDYTHLTAMMAPRPTLLTYNAKDNCCFEAGLRAAEPLLEAAGPRSGSSERRMRFAPTSTTIRARTTTSKTTAKPSTACWAILLPRRPDFNAKEIPSDEEVKTAEELFVELPEKNQDFNSLALQLAADLPAEAELPRAKAAAIQWQRAGRARLAKIVRAKDYKVVASQRATESEADLKASFWWLEMDDSWTVPAVGAGAANPRGTAVLIADSGRAAAAEQAGSCWRTAFEL